jgi:hypothetical protein
LQLTGEQWILTYLTNERLATQWSLEWQFSGGANPTIVVLEVLPGCCHLLVASDRQTAFVFTAGYNNAAVVEIPRKAVSGWHGSKVELVALKLCVAALFVLELSSSLLLIIVWFVDSCGALLQ